MADTFAMVARFTGFVFRNNRSGQGRRLLLALVILLMIGLLGHFVLEAAGISLDALEMPDLHMNVLMVVPLLFVHPFLQIVPVLHSGPSPSIWFPELAPRPPVSLL